MQNEAYSIRCAHDVSCSPGTSGAADSLVKSLSQCFPRRLRALWLPRERIFQVNVCEGKVE